MKSITEIKFTPEELGYIWQTMRHALEVSERTWKRREGGPVWDTSAFAEALAIERGIVAKFDEQQQECERELRR